MPPRLKFLTVEDFRSIRGPVGVSLDAPVVLIHGPNGTGKTSLLAAIELALTGAVPSLARFDNTYLTHLPHKRAREGTARIQLQAEGLGDDTPADLIADGITITGRALLDTERARFYTERCYLAQATLGRLLEIYEHQDNRRSDSPLTRFVKEMLGLEAIDAVIEGLHAAGDVRRFREVAPSYWSARADAPQLEQSVAAAVKQTQELRDRIEVAGAKLRELADPAVTVDHHISSDALRVALLQAAEESERRLGVLASIRRDLAAASNQVQEALAADASGERVSAEQASVVTREALSAWRSGPGMELATIIAKVQQTFPDVSASSSDPVTSHGAAAVAVKAARERSQALADTDDADAKTIAELQVSVRQGQGRIDQIDRELAGVEGANRELAEALTAIASHIEDEHCPVCGRDFGEVSEAPLAAHVSEEVARLVTAAGRVEALVRDRSATASILAETERRLGDIQSRRIPAERRDRLKLELARLAEWTTSLDAIAKTAIMGSRLIREASQSAQALSLIDSRQTSISGLRAELASHASALSRSPAPDDMPLHLIAEDLTSEIAKQSTQEAELKSSREQAIETLDFLAELRASLATAEADYAALAKQQQTSALRRCEAERRIAVARDLVTRAQAVRSEEVRRVFNVELNAVWRELFIRLAPEEDFVPAFALPEVSGRPVEAVLETLYRAGGKGGNPRAMLSAGNLNTAALTLFLALHLSVPPTLPWLVIDDPVQNMDDVHIAQFAALLRTLKQHDRQVIVAVHNRQLFDYLALELSPAINGDRLVTIELGRDADGMTTAPWNLTAFEPDRAIAA